MSSTEQRYSLEQSMAAIQPRKRASTLSFGRKQQRALEEEVTTLKEMLQQSLRREVDALCKIRHLQEMYQELLYRQENEQNQQGSSPEASDDTPNDEFPHVVILKESEIGSNNISSENTIQIINGGVLTTKQTIQTTASSPTTYSSSLAPIPIRLKDVRYEREKPPNSEAMYINTTFKKSPSPTNVIIKHTPLKRSHLSQSAEFINKIQDRPDITKVKRTTTGSFWRRGRSKDISKNNENMTECLDKLFKNFKRCSSLKEDPLKKYLGLHWSIFCTDKHFITPKENKYRDAVWELFQEETKYLTRQLQPLEQVYKGFLEELHFHGILKEAKLEKIFANISELCELSSSIATDLLKLFENRSSNSIAQPNELILSFSMFGHKFNPIYKSFCTNYEQQRGYIKSLEKVPHFQEYLRVCRTAPSVERSDLNDLLIAPMQHQCHYKLLLDNVLKYTSDPNHRAVLHSAIKAFVVSLKELESAIAQQKCSLELLELSEMIYWPSVTQTSTDNFIPQSLLEHVQEQPCSSTLLKSSSRYLKLQGTFKLLDARGRPYLDVQLILLNDLLLIVEIKAKKCHPYSLMYQPFSPDCLKIHLSLESPLRPILTLLHQSPIGQQLSCISVLAPNQEDRDLWVTELCTLGANKI